MIKEHNRGIDLLRLTLMLMICVLHVLGQGGIILNTNNGTIRYGIFWFLEIFCYCAVDSFALISGYMSSNKPNKYNKLISLWFKVLFYSFFVTLFFVLIGKANNIGIKDIITNAFPIIYEKYWYITAYFLMFLSMPILNKYLFSIDNSKAKKVFIVLILLFTLVGFIGDPFSIKSGYSALWIIILYCIGVLGNKINILENKKTIFLLCLWVFLIAITWFGYVILGVKELVTYTSPTILLMGLIIVILFKRIKIKSNIITYLSSLSLGVYLLQCNQVIWNNIILNRFSFIKDENIFLAVFHIFLYSLIIWLAGLLVELFRSKLAKILKIDLLSNKIVKIINNCLEKIKI